MADSSWGMDPSSGTSGWASLASAPTTTPQATPKASPTPEFKSGFGFNPNGNDAAVLGGYGQGWSGSGWDTYNGYSGPGMATAPAGWQNDMGQKDIISHARAAADKSGAAVGSYEWGKAYNGELYKYGMLYNSAQQALGSGHEQDYVPTQDMYMQILQGTPTGPSTAGQPTAAQEIKDTYSERTYNDLHDSLLYGQGDVQAGYDAAKGKYGINGEKMPVGTNDSETMWKAWMQSHPEMSADAGLGGYYDNQRRIMDEQLRAKMGAVGAYGSSAYGDQLQEGLLNLGSQQAKDEASYRLQAFDRNLAEAQYGGGLASAADTTAGNIAGQTRQNMQAMGNYQQGADQVALQRAGALVNAGTAADNSVVGAGSQIGKLADAEADLSSRWQTFLQTGDMSIFNQASMLAAGVTAADMNILAANKDQTNMDLKNGMSFAAMVKDIKGGGSSGGGST
jgi:hypothetical protein